MTQIKKLIWKSDKDLLVLAKGVEKSFRISISYLNSECPASNLKMMPTFITRPLMDEAIDLLSQMYRPYTCLLIDICNYGVTLHMLCIRGRNENDIAEVGKWNLDKAFEYKNSAENFFGYIAKECFKYVKTTVVKDHLIAGKTLVCSLIFRFECEFSSLRDAKVTKFLRNFSIADCLGQDVPKLLEKQFKKHQCMSMFRVICPNMMANSIASTAGICVQKKFPDAVIIVNRGTNLCFFDDRHNIDGHIGEEMIIDSILDRFGEFMGSDDNMLLKRLLVKYDFDYNLVHTDETELFSKMTSGYWLCMAISRFLLDKYPNLDKEFYSISVDDISNLLQYADEKQKSEGKLITIYNTLTHDQRSDLVCLCQELVHRSAKLMAAFTWGILRARNREASGNKKVVTIGLEGMVMNGMYGYKSLFKDTVNELRKLDGKEDLEIEYIETNDKSRLFGIATISNYLAHHEPKIWACGGSSVSNRVN